MSTPSSISVVSAMDASLERDTTKPPVFVFFTNDFPADEVGVLFRSLVRLSKDLRFTHLASLLSLCNRTIRDEVARLPKSWQKQMPPAEDVLALVGDASFQNGPLGGAMEGVFLCIFQLGSILAHCEVEAKPYDFAKTSTALTGLGCGLLAAAAVAVSQTLADLAMNGAEAVRIAFRLGIHVYETSSLLEAPEGSADAESWAYVVPGVSAETVQAELDEYNKKTSNPALTSVFMSASDKTSVSISGPPSRLRACLKDSDVLRYSNFFPLPVHHGLCHAPHIYSAEDVRVILDDASRPAVEKDGTAAAGARSPRVLVPLLSSGTGTPFGAEDFRGLAAQVVDQLLTRKIHVDNVARGIVSRLPSSSSSPSSPARAAKECLIWSFRSSLVLKAIITSIEASSADAPRIARHDLVDWAGREPAARIPRDPKQSKLAVVGMSCRLPGGARDTELFWQLMVEGRDVYGTVPADRFDIGAHYDPTGTIENSTPTPYMCAMDGPGLFDAGFFNMSPREALETDPMHRLALVTAYEALEMAGHVPDRTRASGATRVGTFYGQASDDWRELNASQNIGTYAVPGGERAFANGRVQYFFKFGGPSFNLDTACSSGLAAVNAACAALWAGEADTVLAGGLNVITDPDNFAQLGKGHFLSRTGQCKVWDESADGYCRGDGVGSVVIKRLEDAVADNDNVIAVILSAATNQSAEAASITQPHAPSQMRNYRNVMSRAGVSPLDVSYIEIHGTGTQVGDREESRSVAEVFAPLTPQKRRKSQRLRVGSVKTNIGHGEAAAGISSLLKVLLMYQKNSIPPHIGVKVMNPSIPQDLEERNMGLNLENTPWERPSKGTRFAIVNSFGAHGGNTTVLLEDAPEKLRVGEDPRASYPFTVSARSKNSLKMNIEALLAYLAAHPEVNLGDLSYTLCARRMHHNFRISESVDSITKLQKFLTAQKETALKAESVPLKPPPVAFVFTGQGAFYNGIGQQLYTFYPIFSSEVNRLDRLVRGLGFPPVLPCVEGAAAGELSPVVTQLTIVVIEIALVRFWNSLGIQASVVLGHSLGEYAALVAAGTLSDVDALFLAGSRAELLTKTCDSGSHKMLAVRASLAQLEDLLPDDDDDDDANKEEAYEVSCVNTENDTVISGTAESMQRIATRLQSAGLKCTLLDVPYAFHTAQVEPILAPLERLAENVKFKTPNIPVISPLLTEVIFDGKTLNGRYLSRATREPVDFAGALDAAQELGIADAELVWIELGPHFVAANFVKDVLGTDKVVPSLKRNIDNFTTISSSLAWLHGKGVEIAWNEYFRPYERAHSLLTLPSYKWNEKNYWIPYLGTWTLDKANIKHNLEKLGNKGQSITLSSKLKTSSIHGIISEAIGGNTASIITRSNLLDPTLYEAVEGHLMNGHGVATSSIWADMAFTVGKYLRDQVGPKSPNSIMSVNDLVIAEGQVAKSRDGNGGTQLLQLEATLDRGTGSMAVQLYNASDDGGTRASEPYGTCWVSFAEDSGAAWLWEWGRVAHLVAGRIGALERLAAEGRASRLSRNMAYTLFKNVVDYADRYRGMQSVILHGYEACAQVTLSGGGGEGGKDGVWHTPPHWIDSVAHLAGLVVNGSDASNTADYFYVTPGWESMRFARPLEAGASYTNYVKMLPTDESGVWAGDVYILQGEAIVGMVGQIKFRQFPRLLMDRFFSPKKGDGHEVKTVSAAVDPPAKPAQPTEIPNPAAIPGVVSAPQIPSVDPQPSTPQLPPQTEARVETKTTTAATSAKEENSTIAALIDLIAAETGLEKSELGDDILFTSIGVDSLMSLVLAEKCKSQLKLDIKSSLFLECPTIGEFKEWVEENR
ncbi:Type I Iterative PKS [Diatrype stigma]|uniref:Type I Iterative PKS n=1 Tax=Diatrype stigma TaxID=117547 RepID=A0AAN9UVW7_9PEZI